MFLSCFYLNFITLRTDLTLKFKNWDFHLPRWNNKNQICFPVWNNFLNGQSIWNNSIEDLEHLAVKDSDHWEMGSTRWALGLPSSLPWESVQAEVWAELRWNWQSGKTKAAGVWGQSVGEEKAAERGREREKSRDLKRVPLKYSNKHSKRKLLRGVNRLFFSKLFYRFSTITIPAGFIFPGNW